MVLYFSGTGNSRYAASIIAAQTGDELICLNDIMRERALSPFTARYHFKSDSPFVFVCPTYCYDIPRALKEFLLGCRFEGSSKAYFFLSCGESTGNAQRQAEKLCEDLEFEFMGLGSVKMPDNYIALYSGPSYDDARGILRAAVAPIESAARFIALSKPIANVNQGNSLHVLMTRLNKYFYKFFVKDKKFHANERCTACGHCEKICPLANISTEKGYPVWNGKCTHCMACIGSCPSEAIEYGMSTENRRRYYLNADGSQRKAVNKM